MAVTRRSRAGRDGYQRNSRGPGERQARGGQALHRDQPYIVIHDLPKLDHLRAAFPQLYR